MTSTPVVEAQYSRFSCPNQACTDFNHTGRGNIRHRSWTGKHKDIERLSCTTCGHEFSEREGTLMARSKLPEATVEQLLKCQRWGVCDVGTADICGVDIKTVHRFQRIAFVRAVTHHQQVVHHLDVEGVQLDEAHSKRRPGTVVWIHTALAMQSLFVLWVAFGERTTETAASLIAQVVARLRGVPLFLTDGWKCYPPALLQILGRIYRPRRKGKVGRKPKPRVVAPDHLFYAQVVKVRDRAGRVVDVRQQVVFGGPRRFFHQLSRRGLGITIQTAFMERWYGTLRGWVAAVRRRTRALSWSETRHQGRIWLMVSLYNWVVPHRSLRQGRQPRTPAMAIGLTDHVWSYTEYIWLPVHDDPRDTQQMDERIRQLLTPAEPDGDKGRANAHAPPKKTRKKRKPAWSMVA
jgi:IS1 family transposase